MTYSEELKQLIKTLRDENVSWNTIAKATGKKSSALKQWWCKNRLLYGLPDKIKIRKSIITPQIGLKIKKLSIENPGLPLRSYGAELRKELGDEIRIPSYSRIHTYLKENGYNMIKLLKKPLISKKNQLRRVQFAKDAMENIDELENYTIWSDETLVRCLPQNKQITLRCHSRVFAGQSPNPARWNFRYVLGMI